MSNHQSIKTPSHDRITLSGAKAEVTPEGDQVYVTDALDVSGVDGVYLDANDAIRLAAFLNRFHAERSAAIENRENGQARRDNRTARQAAVRAVK